MKLNTWLTMPLLISALSFANNVSSASEEDIDTFVGSQAKASVDLANQIWELAELGYQEQNSSAALQTYLADAGFKVSAGVAEIPTAFVASFGSGEPTIGILAEFDALPGLSQTASPHGSRGLRAAPVTPAAIICLVQHR